jgi:hypothetical protein
MFDREAKAARAAGAQVQPIGAAREKFVRQSIGESFVVNAKIFVRDAGFRDARRSSSFESEDGLVGVGLGDPASHRSSAEPLVLEKAEFIEIIISMDIAQRIEVERLRAVEPEGRAGVGAEVPMNYFLGPGIKTRRRRLYSRSHSL